MASKVAGELYESITGQLFEVGRQLRQPSGYPFNPNQLKQALQKVIEGKFDGSSPSTLALIKTVSLGKVAGKKTSDCMTGPYCGYRDGDIDRWLPKKQLALLAGSLGVYQLQSAQGSTFREMAAAVLQVGPGTSLDLLAQALKERGHTLTLSVLEQLVEKQEAGEDTGLCSNGWANFAFVEDENGSVSVVFVRRLGRQWYAGINRLGYGHRWDAEYRLLVRNSDAPTL